MAVVGMIAEWNPFHSGHRALLQQAKQRGTAVCVMSGNFVQRGDIAIADKRLRARAALDCGADLVLELPLPYAMSTAQNFAWGGVSILKAAGCDTLLFGSECEDITRLKHAADVLESRDFQNRLAAALSTGMSFAAARDHAADLGGLLKYPNSNLGIEYILAAKRIGANFQFEAFPRRGTGHDADTPDPSLGFASGSYLRSRLLAGDFDACKPYIPTEMLSLLKPEEIADLRRLERAVLTVLRGKTAAQLKRLPDLSEGLENKLFSSISLAKSLDELYNRTKGKRYSHARIRRLVLSAFLGLDSFYFLREPPFTKVLGFSREGEQVLKKAVSDSPFPFLIRTSDCVALSNSAKELFDLELKAADFCALAFEPPKPCGTELTAKLYKTEC